MADLVLIPNWDITKRKKMTGPGWTSQKER